MRHLLATILTISVTVNTLGQSAGLFVKEDFDNKYYPEHTIIKKGRIRCIIDSSEFIRPSGFRIKFYDTLGRIIGDKNYGVDNLGDPFI